MSYRKIVSIVHIKNIRSEEFHFGDLLQNFKMKINKNPFQENTVRSSSRLLEGGVLSSQGGLLPKIRSRHLPDQKQTPLWTESQMPVKI